MEESDIHASNKTSAFLSSWLFEHLPITIQEEIDVEVQETLRWAVGALMEALKGRWL